jgi:hypothetical protein
MNSLPESYKIRADNLTTIPIPLASTPNSVETCPKIDLRRVVHEGFWVSIELPEISHGFLGEGGADPACIMILSPCDRLLAAIIV